MCRKNQLHGACLVMFGLGLLIGHCLESWMIASFGGIGLVVLGLSCLRRK